MHGSDTTRAPAGSTRGVAAGMGRGSGGGGQRVLLLLPFPVFGAAEDYAAILARGLLDRGWAVTVLIPEEVPLPDGGTAIASRGGDLLRVPASSLNRPLRLRSLLRDVAPDIVHVNHDFLPGMAASVTAGLGPTVVTSHTPALEVRYSFRGRALARWAAPRVDAWIVLSARNAALLPGRMPVSPERVHAVAPGLPPERFPAADRQEARARLGLRAGAFVVGTAGRLARQKRHDLLIRAAALAARQVPDLRVAVLGEGELRPELEAQARAELPGRVLFAGHRDDVPALLPAFDIFCLPSDFEGLPFALLEAMAMARPIVVTDVQGSGEAVADGEHGLLVPPGDPEPIAAAILRLAGDPALAEGLGRRARQRFLDAFTAGAMVERTIELYRRLLVSRDGSR